MMLERQLTRAGYAVETAENGAEALTKILEGQYQILLTDWDMPGMDGPTLCKRVREANLSTYVYILLLTGHLTTDDVVVGLGAGADDYVKKPANQAELLARLSAGSRIVTLEQSLREANEKIRAAVGDGFAGRHVQPPLPERPDPEGSGARPPLRPSARRDHGGPRPLQAASTTSAAIRAATKCCAGSRISRSR